MPTATLTSKGQITIPQSVREALGLRTGDRVAFVVRADGTVVVQPETGSLRDLRGIIKPRVRGVSVEDMHEAVRTGGSRR
jgi:AbrB family looped-hinge helix DNA binding protein